MSDEGYVYLLHFARPYYQAQHYLGWSADPRYRIIDHARGAGSPLVAAVVRTGVPVILSVLWTGGRTYERQLKQGRKHRTLCPWCDHKTRGGAAGKRSVYLRHYVTDPVWVGAIEINEAKSIEWWDQWPDLVSSLT